MAQIYNSVMWADLGLHFSRLTILHRRLSVVLCFLDEQLAKVILQDLLLDRFKLSGLLCVLSEVSRGEIRDRHLLFDDLRVRGVR